MKTLLLASIFYWGLYFCVVAQPAIRAVKIDGILSTIKDTIKIAEEQNRLEIFFNPDSFPITKYTYILKDFDKDTVHSDYPIAIYTNLKGGLFTFHYYTLRAGKYASIGSLYIQKERTLFERTWVLSSFFLYLLLLVAVAAFLIRMSVSRGNAALLATRTSIAQDLHDEVGSTLNGIGMAINRIQRTSSLPAEWVANMERIKTDIRIVIDKLRDAVWAITPNSDDDFNTLLDKVNDFATGILVNQNIDFEFDNQLKFDDKVKLRMEQRHNVHLILKEAINNIAKHAGATKASLCIKRVKDGIEIEIKDNGHGFDATKMHEGNGLKNFRKRAEDSFVNLSLHSQIGKGTILQLFIPQI